MKTNSDIRPGVGPRAPAGGCPQASSGGSPAGLAAWLRAHGNAVSPRTKICDVEIPAQGQCMHRKHASAAIAFIHTDLDHKHLHSCPT